MDFDLLKPIAADNNGNTFDNPSVHQVTDVAYRWLLTLFPSGESAYGQSFQVLTTSLVFLAALFASWHILSGIISSAYSGKVLGDRFHQIYAPIRVIIGFGMIMPLGQGFSTVHYLLRDVVGVAAINMANATVLKYYEAVPKTRLQEIHVNDRTADKVLSAFLYQAVCVAYVKASSKNDGINWPTSGIEPRILEDGSLEFPARFCGAVEIHAGTSNETISEADAAAFTAARFAAAKKLKQAVDDALFKNHELQNAIRENVRSRIDPNVMENIAKRILETGWDIEKIRSGPLEEWKRAEKQAVILLSGGRIKDIATLVKSRIHDSGFIAAGAHQRVISQHINELNTNMNNVSTSINRTHGRWVSERHIEVFSKILKSPQSYISTSKKAAITKVKTDEDTEGVISAAMDAIGMRDLIKGSRRYGEDPVGEMIHQGHKMLQIANIAITASVVADVASGFGGIGKKVIDFISGGALEKVMTKVFSLLGYLVIFLVIIGFLFAYVLPTIPFIVVVMMAISWGLMFIEAAIASVLWAFMFIRMDGDELFDRLQSPGLSLLFNLFLRPTLGMLAFFAAVLLVPEMLRAVSILWSQGVSSIYADTANAPPFSLTMIWGWIAQTLIFSWLSWQVYVRIYGLVPSISDKVFAWMGMNGGGGYDSNETTNATASIVNVSQRAQGAPLLGGGPKGRAVKAIGKAVK